jgi:hypothetical protein
MSTSAMTKLATKIAANPKKALTTVAAAAPVVVETAIAIAPVALIGAAAYGVHRLVKWVKE